MPDDLTLPLPLPPSATRPLPPCPCAFACAFACAYQPPLPARPPHLRSANPPFLCSRLPFLKSQVAPIDAAAGSLLPLHRRERAPHGRRAFALRQT